MAGHAQIVAPSSLVAVSLSRDAAGGVSARELWRYAKSFVAVVPSPLVLDGLVYTIKNGGILTVLSADTGEVVKTGAGSAPASYSASPVATGGRIYFANEDGIVAVVRGGKEWELVAANDLGEPLFATPALSAGRIYVRGQKSLFSFGDRLIGCSHGRPPPDGHSTGRIRLPWNTSIAMRWLVNTRPIRALSAGS